MDDKTVDKLLNAGHACQQFLVDRIDALQRENEQLKKEVKKYQDLLEKAWAEHDPAILKMAKEIAELKKMLP